MSARSAPRAALACVVFAATLAGPALAAAEEFGRIEATLNGEARTWYTIALTHGGETDASATFSAAPQVSDLHLQGHPRPSFTTGDVLSIDLMYIGNVGPGAVPMSAEVTYMPTGMTPPIWTSLPDGSGTTVAFDTLDLDGDIGHAAGTFAGTVCLVETVASDPDPTRCQRIEGRFDTQVLIED